MPPEMSQLSMRHTKIKAEEAALLAGELEKPSWESRNEGIHERVSFEDTIWGFDLAGGAYYKTPLRVTYVKPDSRAEKAGIRPGDRLLRINDIETSTLTIQEAHDIIVESGIHLKLTVTSPEDEVDAYYCYQDPIEDIEEIEEQRRREEERARRREVHARVSSYWSLQWPWVSKRRIIYRESNCFMVPSKYEGKHKDKFPTQPFHRYEQDIVLDSTKNAKKKNMKEQSKNDNENPIPDNVTKPIINEPADNETPDKAINEHVNEDLNEDGVNSIEISEIEDESRDETINSQTEEETEAEIKEEKEVQMEEKSEEQMEEKLDEQMKDQTEEQTDVEEDSQNDELNSKHDEIINEVLNTDENMPNGDDDKVLDGILNNIDTKENDIDPSNER